MANLSKQIAKQSKIEFSEENVSKIDNINTFNGYSFKIRRKMSTQVNDLDKLYEMNDQEKHRIMLNHSLELNMKAHKENIVFSNHAIKVKNVQKTKIKFRKRGKQSAKLAKQTSMTNSVHTKVFSFDIKNKAKIVRPMSGYNPRVSQPRV